MPRHPSRRGALLLLAGAAVPTLARAQGTPANPAPVIPPPTVPSPAIPTPTVPHLPLPGVPPISAAPRPALTPGSPIDKTKAYYLFFDQQIDVASMRTLRRQLTTLVEAGVTDITLVIDSPGGQVEPTLITYSFILALPARIATHAQGFVQSAATLLFLAGQDRSADRYARFVFHPTQSVVNGVMAEQQIRERVAAFDEVVDVMTQIYHDRTTLSPADIERFTRETVVYTAEQARAAGVVQTVADLRIPGDNKSRILFLD